MLHNQSNEEQAWHDSILSEEKGQWMYHEL